MIFLKYFLKPICVGKANFTAALKPKKEKYTHFYYNL